MNEEWITTALKKREAEGIKRSLKVQSGSIDFFSNDYLGFSTTGVLKEEIKRLESTDVVRVGATGSRLLSGNNAVIEALENRIALFHGAESSLIFNSGYDANIGLLSAIPTRHDSILYDELSHASIIDGARLSLAGKCFSFRHNDIDDARKKIAHCKGNIFIVVESVYSMDGDFAPLEELSKLCQETGAYLIVDEAHATGIFGDKGKGRVSELSMEKEVFARIHTFGKTLGCHGAAVLGSQNLHDYLVNFAHSFIYTTALPDHSYQSINAAYDLLDSGAANPVNLFLLIHEFHQTARKLFSETQTLTYSPIQSIRIPNIALLKSASEKLKEKDIAASPIFSPTVPKGTERIRICLHTFNAPQEVRLLLHTIHEIIGEH